MKKIIFIIISIFVALCVGVGLFFPILLNPSMPHQTLSYQSYKYYDTALIEPNFSLDDRKSKVILFNTTFLGNHGSNQADQFWKVNSISQGKLIIEIEPRGSGQHFEVETGVWTRQKIDTAQEAFDFLDPHYLTYYVYNDKGGTLKNMNSANQKKLLAAVKNLIKTSPSYSAFSNLNSKNGYISTDEIYFFNDNGQSIILQASLLKKYGKTYLEFSGDTKMEYWQVDSSIQSLLK